MIIIMSKGCGDQQIAAVEEKVATMGMQVNVSRGVERTVLGLIGDETKVDKELIEILPGVENVIRVMKPYKIVSRESQAENTIIDKIKFQLNL